MSANETRVYTMRLPQKLVDAIRLDQEVDRQHGPDPADTLTEWIIRAARERLAHRRRSRAVRRPRVKTDQDGWPLVRVSLQTGGEGC